MFTVIILYYGKDGNALKFANEMISSGLVDLIRDEESNLRYEYFLSLTNDDVILLDSWTCQEALDRHHASVYMQQIMKLRVKYDLYMEVEKYQSINDQKDETYIRR